ncbi:MAG: hypothetical protein ACRD4I_16630 [Candidatus Angelobacter sp.]
MPFSKNYYSILEKRWPHLLQVLSIYLWAAAAAGMGVLFFGKIEPLLQERGLWLAQGWVEAFLCGVCVTAPILVGALLRTMLRKRGQLRSAQAL